MAPARNHDELDARPPQPVRAHVHVLALAAVAPMTPALARRLTVYAPAFCHKLVEDLRHWGWLGRDGSITPAGQRALREMIDGARQELVES